MSSTGESKSPCGVCGDLVGTFTCRGCYGNLCLPHASAHRQSLGAQMNDIMIKHNELKHSVTGQKIEEIRHSLMEQIDHWERQSITKIRQLANDTRQQVLVTVRDRTDDFNSKIKKLTEELENALKIEGFYEQDLDRWTENLKNLGAFVQQQKIKLDEDSTTPPFISRISISDLPSGSSDPHHHHHHHHHQDRFEVYPKTQEKNDFSSEKHVRRFTIENYESNSLILLGVISKTASNFPDPYENPTFFGWSRDNTVYLGEDRKRNYNGYESDFRSGDTFTFVVDCDRKRISLTNERTKITYHLDVDTAKCPFPWQLNIRLLNESE
jgi:hypothetical protein